MPPKNRPDGRYYARRHNAPQGAAGAVGRLEHRRRCEPTPPAPGK